MYEWFHSNGDFKENYKRCVELGTYFDKASQHCPILGDYPTLRYEICNVLRKQRVGGQSFSVVIIQPFIKSLFKSGSLNYLRMRSLRFLQSGQGLL